MNRSFRVIVLALALIVALAGASQGQTPYMIVPADKALLIIRVPASDAAIRIGDFVSRRHGAERLFYSPALLPGQTYSYDVEASWLAGGISTKSMRRVFVQAGKATTVDFRIPPPVDSRIPNGAEKIGLPKKAEAKTPIARDRHFLFTYGGKVKGLAPGKDARVWLPVAVSGPEQRVSILTESMPAVAKLHTEKQYGNTMMYFEAKANKDGEIPFEVVYDVRRKEVKTDLSANAVLKPAQHDDFQRLLQPDAMVPITGKPLELLKDKKLPKDQFAAARVLYDVVNRYMKYSKVGTGWGKGDSVWACDSKSGNCSDFHSLFISMARGNAIPSKFEMGFPLPAKHGEGTIGGYHCWAWFFPDKKGWVPVDISEANRHPDMKEYYFGNLTEDRVRFTTGRDINLEPRQKGPPLNFFIYPYVEVDGKTYPQEQIERHFAYQDVK